jgi:hypothetical protein
MKRTIRWVALALVALALVGMARVDDQSTDRSEGNWKQVLAKRLAAYGHRNWIVVADSAYPAQSKPGIETVVTGAEHLEVLTEVLEALDKAKHVRPVAYLDAELAHVEEEDAKGIDRLRFRTKRALGKRMVKELAHEKIIDRLDTAGEKFSVLVLKTNLTLPYTSVFFELDCGYWSDAAEKRLRKAMKKKGK